MKRLILAFAAFFIVLPCAASFAADFPAKKIYETYSPSVVVIRASGEKGGGMIGAGSLISSDGLVVTNAHVVMDRDKTVVYPKIKVYLRPDRVTGSIEGDLSKGYGAEVIIYSVELDLALLKMSGVPGGLNAIELADPEEIKVGEEVVAIGHPEQGGFWSLTYGRISGEIGDFQGISGKDVFQTDTSVNRGNSGGPLLDMRGYMVAVNSNIARVGADGLPITGVNFSIKSSVVKDWMKQKGRVVKYGTRPLTSEAAAPDEKAVKKIEPVKTETEKKKPEKSVPEEEGEFTTPSRPYDYDELLKAEEELEDMMKDIKGKMKK
ncbi:MAG: serine protease [Thermodesulfobacteriota bacterium]